MPTDKTTELTVEACLAELRKMFPNEAVSIEFRDFSGVPELNGKGYVRASGESFQGEGVTLSEAMAQVRDWKAKQ